MSIDQQTPAPFAAAAPPPKPRNWFARHKILTGVGIFFAIGIIGAATGSNNKAHNNAASTPTGGTQSTSNSAPAKTSPVKAAPTPQQLADEAASAVKGGTDLPYGSGSRSGGESKA
jgi:hypothetical protein